MAKQLCCHVTSDLKLEIVSGVKEGCFTLGGLTRLCNSHRLCVASGRTLPLTSHNGSYLIDEMSLFNVNAGNRFVTLLEPPLLQGRACLNM